VRGFAYRGMWLTWTGLSRSRPAMVAVDGVDGAAKTTFARHLLTAYTRRDRPAHVVHLDDFLNPRTVRYARAGIRAAAGHIRRDQP
jgi:uridine kinase